jgi:hypothetical protein
MRKHVPIYIQCFGSGFDPDLSGQWMYPYPDPESEFGSRRAKMTHKNKKILRDFMF